jgi:hypothetical protein
MCTIDILRNQPPQNFDRDVVLLRAELKLSIELNSSDISFRS